MKTIVFAAVLLVGSTGIAMTQETKPVPKDSVRVFIPGCSKGMIFTAGPRTEDLPSDESVREGTHLRLNGPKATIAEIRGHEGSLIEITGLMKKGDFVQDGVSIGSRVRITPGPSPSGGNQIPGPTAGQIVIDVEAWRPLIGECPRR